MVRGIVIADSSAFEIKANNNLFLPFVLMTLRTIYYKKNTRTANGYNPFLPFVLMTPITI